MAKSFKLACTLTIIKNIEYLKQITNRAESKALIKSPFFTYTEFLLFFLVMFLSFVSNIC